MEMRDLRGQHAPASARYTRLPATDDCIRINIKTLDNEGTWEVESEGSWTVRQLKDHVNPPTPSSAVSRACVPNVNSKSRLPPTLLRSHRPERLDCALRGVFVHVSQLKETRDLKDKRIRLIVLGRMLEDSHTLSFYGLKNGDYVHAAISEELPPAPEIAVDLQGHDREEEDGVRGFDRLRRAGFSQTEVDILRSQFHAPRMHARPISQVEAVELEEEWLEANQGDSMSMGLRGEAHMRRVDRVVDEVSEGTQADMLLGLVMGFVFGVIMLFWIWERGIPRRQKLGILCGIACNLTMGMVRLQARTHARVPGAGVASMAAGPTRHSSWQG